MSSRFALPLLFALSAPLSAAEFPAFRAQEIDPHVGNVCYAVTTADVNGDGKLDVVAVTEDAVVWFANPSWEKQRHQGRHRARQRLHPGARHRRRRQGRFRPGRRLEADRHEGGRHAAMAHAAPATVMRTPPGRSSRSARSRRSTASAGATCWAPARRSSSSPRCKGAARRGRTGARGRACGSWSTPSPTTPPQTPGRSRSPTTRCTRSTTSKLVDFDGDGRTRSCSPPGKGCSCSSATRAAAGRRPSSARATRRRSRSRARAR